MGNGKRQEAAIGDLAGAQPWSSSCSIKWRAALCIRCPRSKKAMITQLVDLLVGDKFWIGCPEEAESRNEHRSSLHPIPFTRQGVTQQP